LRPAGHRDRRAVLRASRPAARGRAPARAARAAHAPHGAHRQPAGAGPGPGDGLGSRCAVHLRRAAVKEVHMDWTPFLHAAIAVACQAAVGLASRNWWLGAVLACTWWLAREHTQAEYRWIA